MNSATNLSSQLGILRVYGDDAARFLQGQVTCNIHDITEQQSRLGAHCNTKGRIQSLFRAMLFTSASCENEYWLSMPSAMLPIAMANFAKYAMFSKVKFDINTPFSIFGVQGTHSLIEQLSICKLPDQVNQCLSIKSPFEGLIVRVPGDLPRYEIVIRSEEIGSPVDLSSFSAWESVDIQCLIPAIYPQTADLLLPHHVNLIPLLGVSFNKGCYLGQEIVARMHYKGKIKKQLVHMQLEKCDKIFMPGEKFPASMEGEDNMVVRSVQNGTNQDLLVVVGSSPS